MNKLSTAGEGSSVGTLPVVPEFSSPSEEERYEAFIETDGGYVSSKLLRAGSNHVRDLFWQALTPTEYADLLDLLDLLEGGLNTFLWEGQRYRLISSAVRLNLVNIGVYSMSWRVEEIPELSP